MRQNEIATSFDPCQRVQLKTRMLPRPNPVLTHHIAVGDTLEILKRGRHHYIKGQGLDILLLLPDVSHHSL